jgi:hypothetical protein
LGKWEYIVLILRTKIIVNRYAQEKNPVIPNVQKELNALGEECWNLMSVRKIRI